MKSPLVVNIRCTCIEEYINIQKLHKEYMRQSKEGEITSIYVGAEFAVPGEFELVDALIAKRGPRQMPYCVNFGGKKIEVADIRNITKEFTKADFEELKKEIDEKSSVVSERITGAQGNGDGTVTETVERVVRPDELPRNELMYEDEAKPDFGPATEPTHFAEEDVPAVEPKPEITLTDVLTAMAEEPDPLEAIKTEAEGEPDYEDGQDYNTTYAG